MKVTVENAKETEKEIKFPCLMRCKASEFIVYMTGCSEGVVIYGVGFHIEKGDYSTEWNMDFFTPLDPSEKVILQND